ncbi:MAG: glycosyltransferase [Trichodesmium sp. MAG_R01]|jgi:glycosyltransferase involved in cell wall biosynthesis|nr:glycosyltransferase [Trichodesmium sp. MAG_R01]
MTNFPTVSIIIPVYNCDRYIAQALDSILSQTYSDYEIIVIDDGSTDDICQVLEPYSKKIKYFDQENKGSASARNYGIQEAKGELIAFLDADDFFLLPEKLAEQVSYLESHPTVGCVSMGWGLVNAEGEKIVDIQPWHEAPKLDLETWLKQKPVYLGAMMFRKCWLERVGGFDPQLRQSHDVDLILNLALLGCQFDWLPKVATSYRQHEDNTTLNAPKQGEFIVKVLDKFFARSDIPEKILNIKSDIYYNTLVWIAWHHYYHKYYTEMAKYLQKSLEYTPYLRVETISDWIENFAKLSVQHDHKLDLHFLVNLTEWKKIIF